MIRRTRSSKNSTIKVTFSLPITEPIGRVSVVGDFNNWTPGQHELKKRANGTRSAAVEIPAGASARFRYLAENGNWFDDDTADAVDGQGSIIRA